MGKEAKYVVRLTMEERGTLESLVAAGRVAADKLLRARMLLKANVGQGGPGWSDEKIAETFEVGPSTIHRLRQRLVEDGGGLQSQSQLVGEVFSKKTSVGVRKPRHARGRLLSRFSTCRTSQWEMSRKSVPLGKY